MNDDGSYTGNDIARIFEVVFLEGRSSGNKAVVATMMVMQKRELA